MSVEYESDRWFYKGPDGKRGPVSTEELRQLLVERAIPAESPVWRYGRETWTPAVELAEFRLAGHAGTASADRFRARGPYRFVLPFAAVLMAVCVIVVVTARPTRPLTREPNSLRERLIDIGRSVDLGAMPTVIEAIVDPDEAVSSTAVTVAERLLGVRYSDSDRKNPSVLVGKIADDWKMTQEQMRRRLIGNRATSP